MRAAVYHGRGDVRVEERPEPVVRPGTVKLRVEWCGICGTDLHEYEEGPIFVPPPERPHPLTGEALPIILGHEFAGVITEVGPGVGGLREGDRVAVDPIFACGACDECRRGDHHLCRKLGFQGLSGGGGGFAEEVVVLADRAYPLGNLGGEVGAMVEPLAVALHAVRKSGVQAGDSAIVYGAGPIGQAVVCCLKAAGAGTIAVVELAKARQEMARGLKADLVLDPRHTDVAEAILAVTNGRGADVAFDCAGLDVTVDSALAAVKRGGTYVMVAIWAHRAKLDMLALVLREINLIGSIAYNRDFGRVISLLKDGRIEPTPMITKRIGLEEIVSGGFDELLTNRDRHVKILVRPN